MKERRSDIPNTGGEDDNTAVSDLNSLTEEEEQSLGSLSKDDLISLIKRISGARWGSIAIMTDDEAYEAARLKLLHGGLTAAEAYKAIPALKEWFDRTKGKPAQSISMDVQDNRLDKMPIDKLLRLAAMLDEPILIAPMPVLGDED